MQLIFKAEIKDLFFDRANVRRAVDRAKKRPLIKGGAFIRRAARSSLKKVRRPKKGFSKNEKTAARQRARVSDPSPAGQPPKSRSSEPNLRTIFFVWDRQSESVVVGPVVLPSRSTDRTAPDLQEHGGRGVVRRRGKKPIRGTWPRRPFMRPALESVLPKIPELHRNFIGP